LNVTGTNNTGTEASPDHSHSFTSDASTANYNNEDTTANSSSNQPSYRTAAYIEFQKEVGGGAYLYNLI
jgi:hypothetical protein